MADFFPLLDGARLAVFSCNQFFNANQANYLLAVALWAFLVNKL